MIPFSFKILNHTITVEYDNQYCLEAECLGQYLYLENKIVLADKYKTKNGWRKHKPETIQQTFYHEMIHCILFYMGHKLWDNEKFVEPFSGLLAQVLEYEIEKTKK